MGHNTAKPEQTSELYPIKADTNPASAPIKSVSGLPAAAVKNFVSQIML
jgi:hypothetical protein